MRTAQAKAGERSCQEECPKREEEPRGSEAQWTEVSGGASWNSCCTVASLVESSQMYVTNLLTGALATVQLTALPFPMHPFQQHAKYWKRTDGYRLIQQQ